MNAFLKHLDKLISLLEEKKIKYEIIDPYSLAPAIEFKRKWVKYRVQMELRDCLNCTIYKRKKIQEVIPINKETKTRIGDYFGKVLK